MKCHHCDNGTVHLTQIINGQMHKMDLCDAVHKKKGWKPDNLSIGSVLDDQPNIDTPTSSMTCEIAELHTKTLVGARLRSMLSCFRPVLEPLLGWNACGNQPSW